MAIPKVPDYTPPDLISLTLPKIVDFSQVGQNSATLEVLASAEDNQNIYGTNGVSSLLIYFDKGFNFTSPQSTQIQMGYWPDGKAQGSLSILNTNDPGSYTITKAVLTDKSNNS